jgi:hypothetical protein
MKIKLQLGDIIKDNNLIDLLGLNPWCVNEGADRDVYYEIEIDDSIEQSILCFVANNFIKE